MEKKMVTSALPKRCFLAIVRASMWLLLMAACVGRPAAAFDEGARSETSDRWVSDAQGLVDKFLALANSYPQVQPPTSYSDLVRSPEKYRAWASSGEGFLARESPDRMLWKLWLLTGKPPLAEWPKETSHDYLQRNVLVYREYVAEHATLSEEALHRIGLTNAIDSIGSPLWYMTLEYLARRASLTHDWIIDVRTTPSSVLRRCPLDEGAYAGLSAALSRWMKVNQSRMVWDPNGRRFRPSNGEYLETGRFLKAIVTVMEAADRKRVEKVKESSSDERVPRPTCAAREQAETRGQPKAKK